MSNTHSFTLKDGRAVTLRKIRGANRMQILRVLGPENIAIQAYAGTAFIAAAVASLDGVPYPLPNTLLQIEALVDILDDGRAIEEISGAYSAAFVEDASVEDQKAAAKN